MSLLVTFVVHRTKQIRVDDLEGANRSISKLDMKRSPLRKLSKKRAVENRKYLRLREKYLRDNPWCEIGASGCNRKASQIHHIKRRGKYLLDTKWFAACCWNCHSFLHDNVKWAKEHHWLQ